MEKKPPASNDDNINKIIKDKIWQEKQNQLVHVSLAEIINDEIEEQKKKEVEKKTIEYNTTPITINICNTHKDFLTEIGKFIRDAISIQFLARYRKLSNDDTSDKKLTDDMANRLATLIEIADTPELLNYCIVDNLEFCIYLMHFILSREKEKFLKMYNICEPSHFKKYISSIKKDNKLTLFYPNEFTAYKKIQYQYETHKLLTQMNSFLYDNQFRIQKFPAHFDTSISYMEFYEEQLVNPAILLLEEYNKEKRIIKKELEQKNKGKGIQTRDIDIDKKIEKVYYIKRMYTIVVKHTLLLIDLSQLKVN